MSKGGGGAGGSGTQKYEWNADLAPYWRSVIERANRGADTEKYPYNPYNPNSYGQIGANGQRENATITRDPTHGVFRQLGGFFNDPSVANRVAGINDDQASAMANIRALALGYTDPRTGQTIPQGGQQSAEARGYLSRMLTGQMGQNPWMGSAPIDRTVTPGQAYNTWSKDNPLAQGQLIPNQYDKKGPNAITATDAGPAITATDAGPATTATGTVSPESNAYSGLDSKYFDAQLNRGLDKINKAYDKGVDANTRRMFNLAGAFGGSAHQAAVKDNQEVLSQQLGDFTNNMLQQQYDRSANLSEADIGRKMQAGQFNIGQSGQNADRINQFAQFNAGIRGQNADRLNQMSQFNAGIRGQNADRQNDMAKFNANQDFAGYENWANRAFQGGTNDMARRERMFENWLNRDMQSQQFNQNLGFSGWENMRNREMSAIPLGFQTEQMAFDRMRNMMGVGDAQRQYEQQIKDTAYNEWLARSNYDKSQVDWLTGLLSRAQGGVAPNVTTQYPGTQISPFGALLGAGALYGAMR